jgi:ketosteroid isomerase-like protein
MLHLPLVLLLSAPAALPPATVSLVAAEYAFADLTAQKGIRAGNLSVLRNDSVVFIPRPVNGLAYYKTQLESGALLSWFPTVAEVAASEDLGYTTGPWTYKAGKDAPEAAWGWSLTLWQREGDGPWKVRLGVGTPNPDPSERPNPPVALPRVAATPLAKLASSLGNPAELIELDKTFAKEAFKDSTVAYKARVDEKVRLYRQGRFPVEGAKALSVALDPGTVTWQPSEGFVSAAGDLGYTRGTLQHKEGKEPEKAYSYVRVWKKVGGAWKVVLDLEQALPVKK